MAYGLILKSLALLLALTVSGLASAMEAHPSAEDGRQRRQPDKLLIGVPLASGRVVRVEADAGRITIEHRPIWHLYMESMTMIFKVRDSAMLTGLTPGDSIRFKVERAESGFVITRIENALQ